MSIIILIIIFADQRCLPLTNYVITEKTKTLQNEINSGTAEETRKKVHSMEIQSAPPYYVVFFFYSILPLERCCVHNAPPVVTTAPCVVFTNTAFFQADAMFCWPKSASAARSQAWLGLPNGCF